MGIRRTKHGVYGLKYHLVWTPKYRKQIMRGEIAQYAEEVFKHICEEYGFWIDTIGVEEDNGHIFLEVPPKYSLAQVVQILKSISAREVFEKFPRLRRQLWAGELWSDDYFVRSVRDKVTAEVIQRYIEYQAKERVSPQ